LLLNYRRPRAFPECQGDHLAALIMVAWSAILALTDDPIAD
jgi:hypothetical protein